MSFRFTPYEKISETERALGLDEVGFRALKGLDWVVTEKIHGAHFCLICDAKTVVPAKRKQVLTEDEDFFNFRVVLQRLIEPCRALFKRVHAEDSSVERVMVHGELFGGAYPHPEVAADPEVQPIQTGVYYSPTVEFCAFDLAAQRGEQRAYFDYDAALELFEAFEILAAAPLLIGEQAAAMAYPIRFASTLPARLGLPPLEEPNWAEGVVIKPVKAVTVPKAGKGEVRPVIKRKIPEFTEDQRYHQAKRWATPRVPEAASATLSRLDEIMCAMVNVNRMHAAISKVGPPKTESLREQLESELIADVQDELTGREGSALSGLSEEERTLLWSVLEDEVKGLLKAHA